MCKRTGRVKVVLTCYSDSAQYRYTLNIVQLQCNYVTCIIFNTNWLHNVFIDELLPIHVSASVLSHLHGANLFVLLVCPLIRQKSLYI